MSANKNGIGSQQAAAGGRQSGGVRRALHPLMTFLTLCSLLVTLFILPSPIVPATAVHGSDPPRVSPTPTLAPAQPSIMYEETQVYLDKKYGFLTRYPRVGWQQTIALENLAAMPEYVIRRQVLFEGPAGAKINIDIWDNLSGNELMYWFAQVQLPLLLNSAEAPQEPNALVRGRPAFFIIQPAGLQAPMRLACLFQNAKMVFRVEYWVFDGGDAESVYQTIIHNFEFESDTSPVAYRTMLPEVPREILKPNFALGDSSCCGYTASGNPYPCGCGGGCGNCTWWAWYKRAAIGDSLPTGGWGDAHEWDTRAAQAGFTVVEGPPQEGAIIVLEPGEQGADSTYGHVAYVEQKVSDTRCRVSDMWYTNRSGNCGCEGVCCRVCTWYYYNTNGSRVHFIYRKSGGTCAAPTLNEPGDGATLSSRTITFRWNAVSGCTFNGYTFRVKNTSNMDSGGTTIIDTGEGGTQRTETINGWDNQDLWWGVKAANAPSGANWAVRRFRIEPGGTSCNPNADQIALFVDANYSGQCVVKGIGDYSNPGAIGLPNDSISSIRVGGNVKATLCRDDNYGGGCEAFTGDDSNLSDNSIGDNQVSSVKVEPRGGGCNPNADQVALYADTNYGGSCVTLNIGDYPNPGYLAPVGNDNVESIRVGSNVQAILYEHDNYGGRSETFTGNDSSLGDNSIGANVVSSVKVQSRVTTCNTPSTSNPCNGVRINQTSNVNFSWSGNCSQYYAEYWGGPAGTIGSGWIGSTSWNPGQLWCGSYSWHVKGKSSGGVETGWSSTCDFTVVPNTPSGLTASAASSSQINLSWNDPGGEKDGYNVYRNGSKVGTTGATTYQDTGLSCNTGYSYYVKAYKGSLESDPSNTASATTQPCGPAITVDSVSVDRCAGGAARTFAAEGPSAIVGQEKSEAFVALAAPVFRRGSQICMGIAGTNHTNNSISTYWSWTTRNSKGEKIQALSYDDWPWTMTPGWNGAGWGPTIPSNLPPGLYTFTGYIRWDGGIDSKSTTFTVVVAGGADFDGDGKADAALYRDGYWFIKRSSDGGMTAFSHGGLPQDKPLVGDFDGDGKADAGIYRAGWWFIKRSSDGGMTAFSHGGLTQDKPLVGDFDGDGKADAGLYRDGYWFIKRSSDGGMTAFSHGGLPQDKPLVGDFDGDGKADAGIYRAGWWFIKRSSDGGMTAFPHGGLTQDKPLVGDFDGDGKADVGLYRDGYWFIKRSSDGGMTVIVHGGLAQDIPFVSDFDGDGKADAGIYRAGWWFIKRSSDGGMTAFQHGGLTQDIALNQGFCTNVWK